jgi:hypothetical protein
MIAPMRVPIALAASVGIMALPLVALAAPERGGSRGAVSKPPATCFWEGPISTKRPTTRGFDGRNFNFPEESATYWLARFHLAEGAELVLRGAFPHGRYMSLNAYSEGNPTDSLSDVRVRADAGSRNPFRAEARRDVRDRSWTVTVVDEPPPAGRAAGEPRERNTIYAQPEGDAPIELAYRVYEPEAGRDLTGGTGLPEIELVDRDGTSLSGEQACAEVNDPNREITIQTVPAAVWQGAHNSPGCDGETNPAHDPPRWERFFNIDYASLAVVTDCTEAGRQSRLSMDPDLEGGFYSNRDSAYVYSHLAQEFGPLLVVEGRLPRFARTYARPERMPDAQLRWWSLCSGESRVTVRTPDCLSDRQVLERSGRDYTIVVSKREDRPASARRRCGVAWLDWGERGDGAGDPGYGLLIMRNMLVSPDFERAIQRVPRPTEEESVMGPYFPRSRYMTPEDFAARGCKAR